MMYKQKIGIALLVLSTASLHAQDSITVSIQMLVGKVKSQNLHVLKSQFEAQAAQADFNQSKAVFLPSVQMSYTGMATTNPLMAFGSKLNQQILTAADFNPVLLNNPDRIQNFATRFEVMQPLINLDGFQERQAARAKMEAYQLQSARTAEFMELELQKAFMQLQLAHRAVLVLKKAQKTVLAHQKQAQDYFAQGMLPKADMLEINMREREVAQQLQLAQSRVKQASDYIQFLTNEKQGVVLIPSSDLTPFGDAPSQMNLSTNRKDVQALEKTTEAYERMYASAKWNFAPRLNAFGSYEIHNVDAFGFGANGYTVGAQLSWNVFDGNKSVGKLQKAKAEWQQAQATEQAYKSQAEMELQNALRAFADAKNTLDWSKLAYEQAQEVYRIRSNRFAQGLERNTDVLQAETQMAQKELAYLQSIHEFNVTVQHIEFLTK